MKKTFLWMAVILLLFGFMGCEFKINKAATAGTVLQETPLTPLRNNTKTITDDGYFWQDWDNGNGRINLTSLTPYPANFTVDWSGNSGSWNFVVGLGLSNSCEASGYQASTIASPSNNKIYHYIGAFEPGTHRYDDGTWGFYNCLLTLYGWTLDCNVEYYVLEAHGEFDPSHDLKTSGGRYSYGGDFVDRDGVIYDIYYRYAGDDDVSDPAPIASKNDNFYQVYSVRRESKYFGTCDRDTGVVVEYYYLGGHIYLQDHINAWNTLLGGNYTVNSHAFQVMAVEGYGPVSGQSDILIYIQEDSAQRVLQEAYFQFKLQDTQYLAVTDTTTFWASGNGTPTNRVGNSNDSSLDKCQWRLTPVGWDDSTQTAYYNIRSFFNGKYLTMRCTDVNATYYDINSNPVFTDYLYTSSDARNRQEWSVETDDLGTTILRSRSGDGPVIGINNGGSIQAYFDDASAGAWYASWNETTGAKEYTGPQEVTPAIVRFQNLYTGRVLTLSDETEYGDRLLKAQPYNAGWNTQQWAVEDAGDGSYAVRLRNLNDNEYLTIRSNGNNAPVITQPLNESWASQKWYLSNAGGGKVRLITQWAPYNALNVGEQDDYADVVSYYINNDWSSQKWTVTAE